MLGSNPELAPVFAAELIAYYIEESAAEGVNYEIAFVQMCLETGYLRFGGLVTPDMNNFCGLGALGPEQPGEHFSSPQIGVRAHIQHLKAYATEIPLNRPLVDPRYRWVRYGAAPTIAGLAGTWAMDPAYAAKLRNLLTRLYIFFLNIEATLPGPTPESPEEPLNPSEESKEITEFSQNDAEPD
jgi:hypothetical protein